MAFAPTSITNLKNSQIDYDNLSGSISNTLQDASVTSEASMKDGVTTGLHDEKEIASSDIDFTTINNAKIRDIPFVEVSVVSDTLHSGCSFHEEKKITRYNR